VTNQDLKAEIKRLHARIDLLMGRITSMEVTLRNVYKGFKISEDDGHID